MVAIGVKVVRLLDTGRSVSVTVDGLMERQLQAEESRGPEE